MRLHGNTGATVPSWMRPANEMRDRIMRDTAIVAPVAPGGHLPLDASDEAIYQAADEAARTCYKICSLYMNAQAIIFAIDDICSGFGIPKPLGQNDGEVIARAIDKSWWLRNLRKVQARRFENHQIAIGATGVHDPYISKASAARQARRNRENQALLESQLMSNGKQEFTLAELAALGQANKAIRRGELMTRIRGFEEIAQALGHVGMFWTLTCPSKFHSVGGTNAKYNGATPRDAQAYLCKIWSQMRSALKRRGVKPYGFRIAEPHTDGCPHWHMLFFVDPAHAEIMKTVIYAYALREDGAEPGADKYRATCKNIRTGYGMSAAAYIAKYIAKNIDGHEVGQHMSKENGKTYFVQKDLIGNEELTPSQRVTYWSQLHGIRQFQQIGGAPVGVWRELRRMTAEEVATAPYEIQEAFHAVQRVATGEQDEEGNEIIKRADWAEYIHAQGGVMVGRACRIKLAMEEVTIDGKYARHVAKKPIGVYAVNHAEEIYKSVRYTWERVGIKRSGAVALDLPRTRVNNCTAPLWETIKTEKNKNFSTFDCSVEFHPDEMHLTTDAEKFELFLAHKKHLENYHLNALTRKYADG